MLVADGDDIYAQVKMTPCGEELICGPIQGGVELVTDGNFVDGDTHWNEAGNNWTIANNQACYTLADGAGVFYQTIAGLAEGSTYALTFTVVEYVGGNVGATLWDTISTPVNADGTYTQYITISPGHVNETLSFVGDISWNGCVSNISLRNTCWTPTDIDPAAVWVFTDDNLCMNGTVNFVSNVSGAITGGSVRYVLSFTVSNYAAGEVDVLFGSGNVATGDFASNGQKFVYDFFITDTDLAFIFTDFIGCISNVSIKLLYPPTFYAVNTETGEIVNLSTALSFVEDRIILKLTMNGEDVFSYGCWKICMINQCGAGADQVVNGNFQDDLSGWTAGPGWAWDDGTAHFTNTGVSSLLFQVFEAEVQACVTVKVTKVVGELHLNILHGSDLVDTITITTPGVYTLCGLITRISFAASGGDGNEYIIDDVTAFEIEDCDDCAAYCSNCIKYAASYDCKEVRLIQGYNDANGSFGFVWNDNAGNNVFKLSHRLVSTLNNPRYPEESNDYTFSVGTTDDTFAQSDKTQQLFINKETGDERVHDVVRLQKRSRHLIISDVNGSAEYWAEKGDYNPDWAEPAGSCSAPARFRVKKKNATLYNNLCG
jgi:hypothetical protein